MEKFYKFDKRLLTIPISASAKLLYMVLQDMQRATDNNKSLPMSAKGCATVRQQTLALKLGISARQVKNLVAELRACGLLYTKRRAKGDMLLYYVQDISSYSPPDELAAEQAAQQAIIDAQNIDVPF